MHGLDCQKCDSHARLQHGFDKPSVMGRIWVIDDMRLDRCPCVLATLESKYLIRLYGWLKRGLPLDGVTYGQQAMLYIQCMDLIEAKINEHDRDKIETMKKKPKQPKRR